MAESNNSQQNSSTNKETPTQENTNTNFTDNATPTIPRETVETNGSTHDVVSGIDDQIKTRDRNETEFLSDKGYREITEKIIEISSTHLEEQRKSKAPLREKFVNIFSLLLIVQYAFIVVFIGVDAFTNIPFFISDDVLRLYIISVFVETLSAMAVMITFAFVSTEETKIVELLNTIIKNYQKFTLERNADEKDENNKDSDKKD